MTTRVAVVGGGVSGLMAAYTLVKEGVEVVLYEKEDYLGSHFKTVILDGTQLDIGFISCNQVAYPDLMELYESLGIDMELSDMSLSVSLEDGRGCEWGTRNGLSSLFAQKKNILNPYFWKMIREITKFNDDALNYIEEVKNNPEIGRNDTLGYFVQSRGYTELFQKAFLIPTCSLLWLCSSDVMSLSAYSVLSFLCDQNAFQLFNRPQWLTQKGHSQNCVNKVKKELEKRGCQIRTNSEIFSVLTNDEGCVVICKDSSQELYDGCIIGAHAPDALEMLGTQATNDELRILGAFQYAKSDIFLHHDNNLMPKNVTAWGSMNFLGTESDKASITYWLNAIQNISETIRPTFLTLNPPHAPKNTSLKWSISYPIPSVAASRASFELNLIQGKRRIWFCGAYQGYGFHEGGLKAGIAAAKGFLGNEYTVQTNLKHMVPSWLETGARLLVTRFFKRFISTGCLILLEEGGTIFTFEGVSRKSNLKVCLRVHSPQFYWKIATEADLGLADAYISGDFSLIDKKEGLINLFMIFIANSELSNYTSELNKKRRWWTPVFFTSAIASTKYFLKHVSNQNTITQARRNISQHYDLSNELFSLFLDETMSYTCAVFKNAEEDLKSAQLRKIHMLIKKARITKEHHILEIGCGWGNLALEVVKLTGCKYTGITLSEKQVQYVESKVKEAGLQDQIKIILCDYREHPKNYKYDRIISCEMIEAVGHEFHEEFFRCCESLLAENGLFVLQYITQADEKYDEYRLSPGFLKEYIFPGGISPSLSRVTSVMATASRLSVVHLEEIGMHYYQTLKCWRENFFQNYSKILDLGFDEKFMRTWVYYLDYSAAGIKSCLVGNYQIVFSRPGDVAAFGHEPYNVVPAA